MLLGLSLVQFTALHVIISLIAIAAGLVFFTMLSTSGRWTGFVHGLFIDFTVLTSVTGFLFPFKGGPPFIFGVVSVILLAIALLAQYVGKLQGGWRRIHLATALVAQWLNMVVLVVQSFQKVPTLHVLAPTGAEPAVLAGQGLMLLIVLFFAWKTIVRPPQAALA